MENQSPVSEEKFEISLKLLGNEIFAMQLVSQSAKKNWAIFGLISLILVTIIVEQLLPLIEKVSTVL